TGGGDAWIVGGTGSDEIASGEGRGYILADTGLMTFDGEGRVTEITATDDGSYGDDTVTSGDGEDWIVGGAGADVITDG
ncbi:type I secretion protein, partial [Cereibacter changlensis JA139]